MTAVFIAPVGYGRFCRLLTVGTSRHITACLASIAADEPVLVTAARPSDAEMCSACREDLRIREARSEDLTSWCGAIGQRAELTVERAAEELFGPVSRPDVQTTAPAVSRTVTPCERPRTAVELFDEWFAESNRGAPPWDEEDPLGRADDTEPSP